MALNIVLSISYSNITDCSIDFDWLQVHINKEQEWVWVVRCRVQYYRGTRRRKNQQKLEQSRVVISDTFLATMREHVYVHQKTMTDKYEISFEIKNVLLPENYMFWTMCFLFFGVLFTDCLKVYIILITLFMIWEQCLILSTGKTVLKWKFHFARAFRGFVNSAWRWGFVFTVSRQWVTVSRNVF